MVCSFSLIEEFDAPSVLSMQMIAEKDAHHVEIMQQLASQRDEEHHHRLAAELEKCDAEHRAIMDQLVKEKLDIAARVRMRARGPAPYRTRPHPPDLVRRCLWSCD